MFFLNIFGRRKGTQKIQGGSVMATSIDQLLDMVLTEAVEGHSHQCQVCDRTFTPTEDGCPFCRSATITPLEPYREKRPDAENQGGDR
jgi:hypothetical protein